MGPVRERGERYIESGTSEEERDKLGPVRERGEITASWQGRRAAPCGNSGRG